MGGMDIFKKNKYKENGVMGKKRSRVVSVTVIFLFFITFLLLFISPLIVFSILILHIPLNIIYGVYKRINENNQFRPLSENEWNAMYDRNLIHYSHILNNQIGSSIIHLKAHKSPKVNFRLPKKYRKEGFVWFHLSDEINKNEPLLHSFLNAHLYEGNSRNQKVIVKLKLIPRNRMFIEKSTGYILILGDLNISGEISEEFEWYNKKTYTLIVVKETLKLMIILFYSLMSGARAHIEESKLNKKKVVKLERQ